MTTRKYSAPEHITSVNMLTVSGPGSEMYIEPILIGHYGPGGAGEIWLEQEGQRIQIPAEHFAAVVRELKRANKIAAEIAEEAA